MREKDTVPETVTRIGFLNPGGTTAERVHRLVREMGLESVSVADGYVDTVVENGVALAEAGAEVLISRGLSALLLRERLPHIPIISIPVSGQDLVQALDSAKRLTGLDRPRIGLITFPHIMADMDYYAGLLGLDLRIYDLSRDSNLVSQVARAKRDGVDVVVAGYSSGAEARRQGMLSVFLVCGDISLRMALSEARQVAHVRAQEKANSQKFRAVLELSRDAVLLVDRQGRVESVNQAARSILRPASDLIGKQATLVVPESLLSTAFEKGQPVLDEIVPFAGGTLLCSVTPIRAEGSSSGAIISLQKTEAISALDTKIRKSLLAKGMLSQYTFESIQGISPQIERTIALARKYAATDKAVLITGETGTGKELFAQAIHSHGRQRQGPFVAVNCAALPPALLESELFGYEEGAFTGARRQGKPGLFEIANGGTLFLDEISEMDHYGQTRLLRVLQERSSLRLGGDKYTAVTARVIAASNRDLFAEVRTGRFREDLFYRLNTFILSVPPLRARAGDIVYLAKYFGTQLENAFGGRLRFSPAALGRLERHPWPGNVRELASVIDRVGLLAEEGFVDVPLLEETLAPNVCGGSEQACAKTLPDDAPLAISLVLDEKQRILEILSRTGGNQIQAAELLQMHRSTLHRKMRKYGIRRVLT